MKPTVDGIGRELTRQLMPARSIRSNASICAASRSVSQPAPLPLARFTVRDTNLFRLML